MGDKRETWRCSAARPRCKNLGTRCFWKSLTANCLQLAYVRRSEVFEATKEQAVPKNMPLSGLQGRFCKPRCSQVFTSWPGSLRYRQTLSYLSVLSFLPSDQPCPSLMVHHEFCRLSRIERDSRNDCLKTAVDEIQWIEAAGSCK